MQPRRAAVVEQSPSDTDNPSMTGAESESDEPSRMLLAFMEAHKKKRLHANDQAQAAEAAQVEAALTKAEEMIQQAKQHAAAQIAEAAREAEQRIAAESQKVLQKKSAFSQSVKALLEDTAKASSPPRRPTMARMCSHEPPFACVAQAIRDLKASAKESAREIDDFRGAGARVIASHEAACEKQMKSADAKTEGLAKMQIRLAPVVKEIAKLTRAIEAEGP